ncbi:MAG: hypothetical protein BWY06_03293 [Candidatus Latescibacteria bacterium ADurb.Bin168]|nr:MAG: hypothetical protein BWY06_03293 [Candidatus Latescibacteria bacterium ADurb.Bin168]
MSNQFLCERCRGNRVIEIRNVDELPALLAQCLQNISVPITERIYCQTRNAVKIAFPFRVDEVDPFPAFENNVSPCVVLQEEFLASLNYLPGNAFPRLEGPRLRIVMHFTNLLSIRICRGATGARINPLSPFHEIEHPPGVQRWLQHRPRKECGPGRHHVELLPRTIALSVSCHRLSVRSQSTSLRQLQ